MIPTKRRAARSLTLAAFVCLFALAAGQAQAGSAQWLANPVNDDWRNAANWTAGGPPNEIGDTATFATSSQLSVLISPGFSFPLSGVVFSAGGNAFSITVTPGTGVAFLGAGIVNASSHRQTFILHIDPASGLVSALVFRNGATAGSNTSFINEGSASSSGGFVGFSETSSADHAAFINEGGLPGTKLSGGVGGQTAFDEDATAADATFSNLSATGDYGQGGTTYFTTDATAGNATFHNAGASVIGPSAGGWTYFMDNATAGNGTFFHMGASSVANPSFLKPIGGRTEFYTYSSADNGTFITYGADVADALGGEVRFFEKSTAGNASFTHYGGQLGTSGTTFYQNSTAGGATLSNNGAASSTSSYGYTVFMDSTSADSAALIGNDGVDGGPGGLISFQNNSSGGISRVKIFGLGTLDIALHNAPGLTIGSLEGDGKVTLGSNRLSVGSNNLSTTFSGKIVGTGSFTKIGSGTLTLLPVPVVFASGGTFVAAGTLNASEGSLGAKNVSITAAGATLTLDGGLTSNYIADNASISIVSGCTVNLNSNASVLGPDRIGALLVDGILQPPGLYGSVASGAPHSRPEFSGPGQLLVLLVANSRKTQGATSFDIYLPMPILIGDTNGNGVVNASDITQTKLQSGHTVTNSNFREDVNGDGSINASDIALVKTRSGTGLPEAFTIQRPRTRLDLLRRR